MASSIQTVFCAIAYVYMCLCDCMVVMLWIWIHVCVCVSVPMPTNFQLWLLNKLKRASHMSFKFGIWREAHCCVYISWNLPILCMSMEFNCATVANEPIDIATTRNRSCASAIVYCIDWPFKPITNHFSTCNEKRRYWVIGDMGRSDNQRTMKIEIEKKTNDREKWKQCIRLLKQIIFFIWFKSC